MGGEILSLQTLFKAAFSHEHILPSQASLVVSVGRDAALAGYGEAQHTN